VILILAACSTGTPTDEPAAPAPAARPAVPEHVFPAPLVGEAPDGPVPTGPDVVFVSIDTLRPDHLGAYGYERPTSPFIDRLASDGVRFAHARSPAPWTLPSHTTMLTGQLPTTHGVVEDTLKLSREVPVLPELLQAKGYTTAAAVSTLFVSSRYGFERGFQTFQDFGILHKKLNLAGLVEMDDVVDTLATVVQAAPADRPLFLFLHTYDAHYAYDPPAPYSTLFDRAPEPDDPRYRSYGYHRKNPLDADAMAHQVAQYDESIRWIDAQLERLDGLLRAAGRSPRWVITSDHGEEFGERGSWGHGHTLYAEQLRVPLIVSGPGLPSGRVVEEVVGLQDLAPTIAAWTGVEGLARPDGIDLTPYLAAGEPPARPFLGETSRHRSLRFSLHENGQRLEWDLRNQRLERFVDAAEEHPLPDDGMRERVLELLGKPWTAPVGGELRVQRGVAGKTPFRARQAVRANEAFAVFPLDATFRLFGADGELVGAGGLAAPDPAPFVWTGGPRPVPMTLDEDTKSALEALGYVHDDE
jgi:arylsulfatase A-like enzyme